jgi:hypothetical protein
LFWCQDKKPGSRVCAAALRAAARAGHAFEIPGTGIRFANIHGSSIEAFQAAIERMRGELGQAMPEGVRYTPGLYRVIRQ